MIRQTSVDAFNAIKAEGLLPELQFIVYEALLKYGPCTANELVWQMKANGNAIKSRDYFAQRLSELLKKGVAATLPKRPCTVTNRMAMVWVVTNKLPVKFEKPERHKCKACDGKGYTQEVQAKLF